MEPKRMQSPAAQRDMVISDLLMAIVGPGGSNGAAVRHLQAHLAGRPGWLPLTAAMIPCTVPTGWSEPMVRLLDDCIDIAMSRATCLLSSNAASATVTAVSTDILPETLALGVVERAATVIYGNNSPFDRKGWITESVMVLPAKTKILIRTPRLVVVGSALKGD